MVDLRTSIEVGVVTWALAQADLALKGRPIPEKISDLHHAERRRYEDAAAMALRMLNRDAELYAEGVAASTAFAELEQFCKDHNLDWLSDSHPVNEGDALEMLLHRCARKSIRQFRAVLSGTYPGLSRYLARLDQMRATDTDPALAKE